MDKESRRESQGGVAVVPDRGRWLRTHPLEVALVVLTPPFLPSSLQALRAFRLLRVLRLIAVVPYARRSHGVGIGFLTLLIAPRRSGSSRPA
jgi:hypothetical protein